MYLIAIDHLNIVNNLHFSYFAIVQMTFNSIILIITEIK